MKTKTAILLCFGTFAFAIFLSFSIQKILAVKLGSDLDMQGTYRITNLPVPTSDSDAATKGWVLGEVAGGKLKTKRIFVTSVTYNGNLGGLSGADAKCQARADAAGLGGTWKALLGDANTNLYDRIGYDWDILVDMHNRPVVARWEIWGPVSRAWDGSKVLVFYIRPPDGIEFDEFGNKITPPLVAWTGANTAWGQGAIWDCNRWTTDYVGESGIGGGIKYKTSDWLRYDNYPCNMKLRLYCVEQ